MSVFKDINDCIELSKISIGQYSKLNELIDENDFTIWRKKLNDSFDFENFLIGTDTKLNILNTSVMVGLSIRESLNDNLFNHYRMLLNKTEIYLTAFPELINNKSFKDKIKNIENLNYLSTLSELSLALFLKQSGFDVFFETKFKHALSDKKRDIDITAIDKSNRKFHFEVYMPNQQLDISGFFNPNQEDSKFSSKIKYKLFDKFGQEGINEINGRILLAVNKVFFDMIHFKTALTFLNNKNIYNELLGLLPKDVDGILFFEDEFSEENSFRFDALLINE
jgi:hypothetical protein